MKRLYTTADIVLIGHLASLLDEAGIPCFVKNQYLSGGIGELPPTETWPELWVRRDHEYALAKEIVEEATRRDVLAEAAPAWRCPGCGEEVEGQFALCWNCGEAAPPM